jgi:hypothetical protein
MNSNTTRILFAGLLIAGCFVFPVRASTEEIELWHGWMDLWLPCDLQGDTSELHGYINADIDTDIVDLAQNCAITAAATTTVLAILTEGMGGWETFTASFSACMGDRADDVADLRLESETVCGD